MPGRRRPRGAVSATATLVLVLLAAGPAVAVHGYSGPTLGAYGSGTGISGGYVGTDYESGLMISLTPMNASVRVLEAHAVVSDGDCDIRLWSVPTHGFGHIGGAAGPLGQVLGDQNLAGPIRTLHSSALSRYRDIVIVLTPRYIGRCAVSSVAVRYRSGWRTRSAVLRAGFEVSTTHMAGVDSRALPERD